VKVGDIVMLRPAKGAANRTKNRIRENGPAFIMRTHARSVSFDNGARPWINFESVAKRASDGKGGKEAWVGWLPQEEVEVISESR
jgi:hypothetical protein